MLWSFPSMHNVHKFPNSTSLCQLGTPQFPKFPNVWGVPSWILRQTQTKTASAGGWICWMDFFRCAIDDGHYQMVYIRLCHAMYIYILYYIILYCYILYFRLLYIIYTYNTDLSRDNRSYELSKSRCFLGFRQWRSSFHGEKSTNQAGFDHDLSENKVSCNSKKAGDYVSYNYCHLGFPKIAFPQKKWDFPV